MYNTKAITTDSTMHNIFRDQVAGLPTVLYYFSFVISLRLPVSFYLPKEFNMIIKNRDFS